MGVIPNGKGTKTKGYPKLKNYKPSQFMLPTSRYDKKKADRAVTFIENLCHTKGKWAGTPFWLLPWQEQLICWSSRPKIEGKTNEEKKEVQTETLTIKATPLSDGKVKAKTGNTTDATVYADWYKAVYLPAADPASLQAADSGKSVVDAAGNGKALS